MAENEQAAAASYEAMGLAVAASILVGAAEETGHQAAAGAAALEQAC